LKHDDEIPNYPEAVNQLTRLEVLEVLAMLHYPQAQEAIKAFLKERRWGVTGMASALLLTEGDETAVDLVKGLLNDPDKEVRLQAALILAVWGREEDVVKQLQDAYVSVDRDLKGQILEGIGRVGSASSLPFLAERLQDPFPTLRIIAAAATLECLYH
jgi:HEAT repeat protein